MDSVTTVDRALTSCTARRWQALAAVCAAVYVINLDLMIVNVALPSLIGELHATTRDLQWIVDAYNLTFTALVIACGSLSDRYGRRRALLGGLVLFAVAAAGGSLAHSIGGLVAARAVMGVGAAIIFPTTLSIIANVFPDRRERSYAVGIWGAVTGIGVATGPWLGGWLLEHFWWGSVFLVMVPAGALALLAAVIWVPDSRDPATPALDRLGLVMSTAAIGVLVYTIIESPHRGWASAPSTAGFTAAGVLIVAFVLWEVRLEHPMVDVSLFRNLRFSAACVAVTVAWFSLFGFIFLITQYFQFLKGYGPLRAGAGYGPVAAAIAVGSVLGVLAATRIGNKIVVSLGLTLMGIFFLWVSTVDTATPYWPIIVSQMVVIGLGLGLTTAPATEAIMGVVPKEKAGMGSALNDACRELGGTLGVAIIGSIFTSLYTDSITGSPALNALSRQAAHAATDSVGAAVALGHGLGPAGAGLLQAAGHAYYQGLSTACVVASVVALIGAAFAAAVLPAQPLTVEEPSARSLPEPVHLEM